MSNRDWYNPQYKKWRLDVYHRDKFKCCWPNCKCKTKLNAHHILDWSRYPLLRFNVNNGITLCKKHHKIVTGRESYYVEFLSGLIIKAKK